MILVEELQDKISLKEREIQKVTQISSDLQTKIGELEQNLSDYNILTDELQHTNKVLHESDKANTMTIG